MTGQFDDFERLIQVGEIETAEKLLFDWIKDHPNDAYAWLLYGKCVSNPSQKRDCFKRAVTLDPSNTEAKKLLDNLTEVGNQVHKPIVSIEKVSSLQPEPPSIPKSPQISEKTKAKLSFAFYSLIHFLFTIFLGIFLVIIFSSFVPGLLTFGKNKETIQRNWLSNSDPSNVDQELLNLTEIFLNPSNLDYREVKEYQDLNLYIL